jgi:hypothetical protein
MVMLVSACMMMKKIEMGRQEQKEGEGKNEIKFCFCAQTGRDETREFA